MKQLSLFQKLLFFINSLCAIALLVGYALPFVPPHIFPVLSVISLALPFLLIVNIIFFIFWLLKLKRAMLLSGLVLLLGFGHLTDLYHVNSGATIPTDALTVMSYNVRLFGKYGWKNNKDTGDKTIDFITSQQPDIVCLQEYRGTHELSKKDYPYRYEKMRNSRRLLGLKIYSKYPIIDKGSLDFDSTSNNTIYADIVKGQDTLRVYNVHFESLRIKPQVSDLQKEDSKRLLGRIGAAFVKQEEQAKIVLAHEQTSPYPVIVTGDFNNRSSSYLYRTIKGDKIDAFAVMGNGIGTTFNFDFLPIRIDFMLSDPIWKPVQFKNYKVDHSDHYPILAKFSK